MSVPDGVLLGMGNPLLDIQTNVDKAFLEKWGLKENDAILCDEKHVPMFDELTATHHVEYIPGGAAQNAVRVAQWILNEPNKMTYFGAVGSDKYGEMLRKKAAEAGVNVQYQVNNKVKTGTCAALINGNNRSLCAHLAAAETFTVEHLEDTQHWKFVETAKYFYVGGFFLTVCPPAIMEIAKHAKEHNKIFMLNLSAPFISQFFYEPLSKVLPYVDYLFGNEDEARAFSKASGFDTEDIHEIALKASQLPKENSKRPRVVVITQGAEPTVVAQEGKLQEFPVIILPKEKLIDTNGAGDAFVGGFLAEFVREKPLADCISCANYAASEIIQQQGCTFPDDCNELMDSNETPTYCQLRNAMSILDEHDDMAGSLSIPAQLHIADDEIDYDENDSNDSDTPPELQEIDTSRLSKDSEPGEQNGKTKDSMLHEQDRLLPIANVTRVMRGQIPASGKMAKEAKELVQDCVSEFISFITAEANDRCLEEKRKVITSDDLLDALKKLGFDDYVEPMEVFLKRYRAETGKHGTARPNSGRISEQASGSNPTTVHNSTMPPSVSAHAEEHTQEYIDQQQATYVYAENVPDPTSLQPSNYQIMVDPTTGQHYLAQPGEEEGELELLPINLNDQIAHYVLQPPQQEGEEPHPAQHEVQEAKQSPPAQASHQKSPIKRSPNSKQNGSKRQKFS
ncbi:unnamed protein product, partial [Mesorhabditis belari]